MANAEGYVTEIPSSLKQLARLIIKGFYQIEDSLIIDMLVRIPCIKEKDLEDLLKFDLKLLRSRMSTLRNDKIVQVKLRMETGLDGKAQKVNYYYINYKSFVNVVKYKLDHMRKRMETQERDATNRASFICKNDMCGKAFTDLEAGELNDPMTGNFLCTFCGSIVEEDETSGPKKDSRLLLAKFNEQLHSVFDILRKVEDIKLAPELLEPEPPRSEDSNDGGQSRGGTWSGEATRLSGINEQTRIDITFGNDSKKKEERKERPIWMMESTIGNQGHSSNQSNSNSRLDTLSSNDKNTREDIMSFLLTYEKKGEKKPFIPGGNESDDDQEDSRNFEKRKSSNNGPSNNLQNMNHHHANLSDFNSNLNNSHNNGIPMDIIDGHDGEDFRLVETMDDDGEDQVPLVSVGSDRYPITEINDDIIDRMSSSEKETYIQMYQDYFAHIYD